MTHIINRPLTLSQFVPYRVVNLATSVSNGCSNSYQQQYDISIPEWRILARLAEEDKLNAKQIGIAAFMDKSTVSRAIKSLVAKALLVRVVDENDNRAARLSLTQQGIKMYTDIANHVLAWEAEMLSALTISERTTFFKLLDKLDAKVSEMRITDVN